MTAIEKLKHELAKYTAEELQQQFTPDELAEISYTLTDAKCAKDPLYWAQNWTATENPLANDMGLPFTSPMPRKSYFGPLFEEFAKSRLICVPKSRDMLTSWCTMVWAVHQAQWFKAEVIVQTQKEEKAKRLCEYAQILYRNEPDWLKNRHPLKRYASALAIEWADGGKVFGVAGGPDQVRMFKPKIFIMDEAAFMWDAGECYAAAYASSSYVQIIAVSSAGNPGSWFALQCER